jgi:hypothetical protein
MVIIPPEGGHPTRHLAQGRWNYIPSHQAGTGRRQSSQRRPDLTLPSPPPEALPPLMSGSPSSRLRPGSGWSCRCPGHEGTSTSAAFPLGKHRWQLVRSCATPQREQSPEHPRGSGLMSEPVSSGRRARGRGLRGPSLTLEVPPVGTPGRRRSSLLRADRAPAGRATCAPASTRRELAKKPGLPSSVHVSGAERLWRITPPPAAPRRETSGGAAPPATTTLDPIGPGAVSLLRTCGDSTGPPSSSQISWRSTMEPLTPRSSSGGVADSGRTKSDFGHTKARSGGKYDSGRTKARSSSKADAGCTKDNSGPTKARFGGKADSGRTRVCSGSKADSGRTKARSYGKADSGRTKARSDDKTDSGRTKANSDRTKLTIGRIKPTVVAHSGRKPTPGSERLGGSQRTVQLRIGPTPGLRCLRPDMGPGATVAAKEAVTPYVSKRLNKDPPHEISHKRAKEV